MADDIQLREEQDQGAPNEHVREYQMRVWERARQRIVNGKARQALR